MNKAADKGTGKGAGDAAAGGTDRLAQARTALIAKIGYQFKDFRLLEEALTHASVNAENEARVNNQRLEFLGDRVIGLALADMLFKAMPEEREGVLTVCYNKCVGNNRLAMIARRLGLGAAVEVIPDTEKVRTDKVLADALEALMGAIWLDGGIDAAREVVQRLWDDIPYKGKGGVKDSKTRLQEYALERKLPLPEYRPAGQSGPDHALQFTISVCFNGHTTEGMGTTKRDAEQAAAALMLERIS